MTARTKLICEIIDSENLEFTKHDNKFEIINPFGSCGGHNNPENVMILNWLHSNGATYVFHHTDEHDARKYLKPNNIVFISARCGQKTEFDLSDIDEDQEIDEVVIRGVKYVRE